MSIENIFDAFMVASERVHLGDSITKANKQIIDMERKCGSCSLWMTQQCPPERNGRFITCNNCKCSSFNLDSISARIIQDKRNEVLAMQQKLINISTTSKK